MSQLKATYTSTGRLGKAGLLQSFGVLHQLLSQAARAAYEQTFSKFNDPTYSWMYGSVLLNSSSQEEVVGYLTGKK